MKKQVVIRVCGSDNSFVVKKASDIHDIPGLKLVFHDFLWSKAHKEVLNNYEMEDAPGREVLEALEYFRIRNYGFYTLYKHAIKWNDPLRLEKAKGLLK